MKRKESGVSNKIMFHFFITAIVPTKICACVLLRLLRNGTMAVENLLKASNGHLELEMRYLMSLSMLQANLMFDSI